MAISYRADSGTEQPAWLASLRTFQSRSRTKALGQIANTLLPYLALWGATAAIVRSDLPWYLSIVTIIPAAFFLVRTFIIFHDCCHGSFFPNQRANTIVGYALGALAFTSYHAWRRSHLKHHATTAQLDHRGDGDVWTMTYDEYQRADPATRRKYRFFRNPIVLFVVGPLFLFVFWHRITSKGAPRKVALGTLVTNAVILALSVALSLALGVWTYLFTQLAILWGSTIIGVWLFYVQHQFDPSYWERDEEWDRVDASLYGSSYYKLPKILNWLTGNIGLHHIHHLHPRIPNYRLVSALESTPEVQVEQPLTIRKSLKSIRMKLWHEAEQRFITFREARRMSIASDVPRTG